MKKIYFAGGCFWGTQHFFKQIKGVIATATGYANGNKTEQPTYEQVYSDTTGFAECVEVIYDAELIALPMLIELYFRTIDPLSINRQGEDYGTRYRTGIYYTDKADLEIIESIYNATEQTIGSPLAVEVEPLKNFYPAEEYHQDYLDKNPTGYCHIPTALIEAAKKANR